MLQHELKAVYAKRERVQWPQIMGASIDCLVCLSSVALSSTET